MCRISKYTTVFRSESGAPYVYNALSNRLFRITERIFSILSPSSCEIISSEIHDSIINISPDPFLFENKTAVDLEFSRRSSARHAACQSDKLVDLSICPTLHCNFKCDYCFESDQNSLLKMSHETCCNVVTFAEALPRTENISISWYGGEPLINFSIMQELTSLLLSSKLHFLGAGLVTNGYLLTKDKISHFEEMHINSIQITIDGPPEIHNKRRMLKSGRPTFSRIIDNIDNLFSSNYRGSCNIRVNLDKRNIDSFQEIQSFILDRYPGRNISVYGGRVERLGGVGAMCGASCGDTGSSEWVSHLINQCSSERGNTAEQLYPISSIANICTATMKNSYVIGPRGELYKCWEDVGNTDMEVGNIVDHLQNPISRLEELYETTSNPYTDDECVNCSTMPICGGGCANRRVQKLIYLNNSADYCSLYKFHLVDFLSKIAKKYEESSLCEELLSSTTPLSIGDFSEISLIDDNSMRKY